ncbi:hypothetical protein C454_11091 [Haloferax gibbonsii ATCC 33959]|uniref:Uncharacterized protein n=1 Tax=Haloferax gibbonsii (strain ATCC 33959 / DSM 4427 / JCM 8863 / NBRC 102184 / NCIMB 2188 / Ma 2.38) TaxID=1227459 RepID=M0HAK4_HALGM|nr:hypothetical protein C454_11091 [Haloferax gibbonsii ATCC 33959]
MFRFLVVTESLHYLFANIGHYGSSSVRVGFFSKFVPEFFVELVISCISAEKILHLSDETFLF